METFRDDEFTMVNSLNPLHEIFHLKEKLPLQQFYHLEVQYWVIL